MNRKYNIFLFLMIAVFNRLAAETEHYHLIQDFYDHQNLGSFQDNKIRMKQLLTERENGETAEIISSVFTMGEDSSVVLVKDDEDASQVYLTIEDSSWLYKPGLRSPLKISDSFSVFGSLNLVDILGIKLITEYEMMEEIAADHDVLFRMKALKEDAAYPFVEVRADLASGELRTIILQGLNRRPLKEITLKDYSVISGNHRLPVWEIRDLLFSSDKITIIRYLDVSGHNLPRSLFYPNVNSLTQLLRRIEE